MNRTALFFTSALAGLTLLASTQVSAQEKPLSKKEVEEIIKQVIMDNPEVMMKSIENYQVKMQADRAANAAKVIQEMDGKESGMSPVAGNPKGDITVTEFFDYHCGYCKHMLPVVTQLLEEDKNVKVVFKEFPILSEDSTVAAKAALAVYKVAPKKYFEFHTNLMKASGSFDEAKLLEVAKSIGIDPAKVKTEMASKEVEDEISQNRELANKAGISGTPAMIIGGQLIPGAVQLDDLKKKIAEERASKKK